MKLESTEKLDFREWLVDKGILLEYLRLIVSLGIDAYGDKILIPTSAEDDHPAFWFYVDPLCKAPDLDDEEAIRWLDLEREWDNLVDYALRRDIPIMAGLPLDDPLGLALALAELEE